MPHHTNPTPTPPRSERAKHGNKQKSARSVGTQPLPHGQKPPQIIPTYRVERQRGSFRAAAESTYAFAPSCLRSALPISLALLGHARVGSPRPRGTKSRNLLFFRADAFAFRRRRLRLFGTSRGTCRSQPHYIAALKMHCRVRLPRPLSEKKKKHTRPKHERTVAKDTPPTQQTKANVRAPPRRREPARERGPQARHRRDTAWFGLPHTPSLNLHRECTTG